MIASDPAQVDGDFPKLWVENPEAAVMAMARYARARFTGRVIAVTGSAGKTTTVAMLAHALRTFGLVGQTSHNANLPLGVAWNIASMRWDDPYVVLELGIGRMAQSAALARPDLTIFTTIAPAHLTYHATLELIARRKSRIFLGMKPGATVILNRDMPEWEIVAEAAERRGLVVRNYGAGADCDYRLEAYDSATREVHALLRGRPVRYALNAAGEHMARNSLAALAATCELGHDAAAVLDQLAGFTPIAGRGQRRPLQIGDSAVEVIDESYNANPSSMRAALELLASERSCNRRIAVLGEMAELGTQAERYHRELAGFVSGMAIDRVYVLGEIYRGFCAELPPPRVHLACSHAQLADWLKRDLRTGDCLLLKGSGSAQMSKVLASLSAGPCRPIVSAIAAHQASTPTATPAPSRTRASND